MFQAQKPDGKVSDSDSDTPFFCFLPEKLGVLTGFIINFLFRRIQVDSSLPSGLRALRQDGIVIFVNKYKSAFEFLLCHTRLGKEGLPAPCIGFDYTIIFWQPLRRIMRGALFYIKSFLKHLSFPDPYDSGYISDKLISGEAAFLSLIEDKGFYRRLVESKKDPIDYLIEIQTTLEAPIYFVPQVILYDTAPGTRRPSLIDLIFGTSEKPGRLRRLFLLIKSPGKIIMEAAEPVRLDEFLARPDVSGLSRKGQVARLRRYLTDQINQQRQTVTGPALKSRDEIIEEVLTSARLEKKLSDYASKSGKSLYDARGEAAEFLDEIAANLNTKIIRLYDITLRWITRAMFDGMVIDYEGLNRVKQASRQGPLIMAPCHKSHLDYLIISYLFHNNKMPCPHIAAGKNLSFWPLGPIFRGGGAFFLRRTFKGEPLYPDVFSAYLNKILEEGYNVEFFIEGGRSRTGKLLFPKTGFLTMLMDAYRNGKISDLIFVPIYIGYDRVLEEKAYANEVAGGKKSPENIKNVIKAGKFLKRKYGKIYVNFHEPFSLKEYIDDQDAAGMEENRPMAHDFARKIIAAINSVTVVTPHAVIAGAILNSSSKHFYYRHVLEYAETYMNHLSACGAPLSDTLFMDKKNAFRYVIETFVENKYIEGAMSDPDTAFSPDRVFKINENRRSNLEYYKNNAIAFFIPGAFTALSLLAADAFQLTGTQLADDFALLANLFENEFIINLATPEEEVRKNLKAFIDEAIIAPHPTLPDTYNLTSAGFRKLNLFAAFLTPHFESYLVVLNFYQKYASRPILETKDYLKKIQSFGMRMFKRGEITRKEALSKINYKNAVTYFTANGLNHPEADRERLDYYMTVFKRFRRFLKQ
ncbi:MAG: glycerol-3-phosphate acyltransferase [Deltaproteobacteria bacterium]|nr:glycerol-3-phosphate acyltransferase [Deltaproteobacteria bacterium]